jgi:hypothetical protein
MKHAFELGSVAMIYIPSFINIGSSIQKLIGGNSQTHRQHGDRMSLLSFLAYFPYLKNESRLMRSPCCLCVCESPLSTFECLKLSS